MKKFSRPLQKPLQFANQGEFSGTNALGIVFICKDLGREGGSKASGVSVRGVGLSKMLDWSCGAREGTRTPTDCSTGS
jgi:hypothetical protein